MSGIALWKAPNNLQVRGYSQLPGARTNISVETADPAPTDLDKPVENMKRDVTNILKKMGSTIKRDVLHRSYSVSETERTLQDVRRRYPKRRSRC